MPLFEYHCQACKTTFEKLLAKAEPVLACPTCGKAALRAVSAFAAGQTGSSTGGCSAPPGSGFS